MARSSSRIYHSIYAQQFTEEIHSGRFLSLESSLKTFHKGRAGDDSDQVVFQSPL